MSVFAQAPATLSHWKATSMLDLAIVGASPAGTATAYFVRDLNLDVTIFEAGDEVGGRTRSVPVGGIPSNTGALFVYRDTPAEELAGELGIRTAAFTPETYGRHRGARGPRVDQSWWGACGCHRSKPVRAWRRRRPPAASAASCLP
jgi:phytoene dehydrogenase-like protein